MKKVLLALFTLVVISSKINAQTDSPKNLTDSLRTGWWDKKSQFGINLAQVGVNDAYSTSTGSINNLALSFLFGHKADYHKGKGIWANEVQLQYGMIRQGGTNRKSLDRLFLDTKYAHKISDKWNWFIGLNAQSQFAPGYDFPYSDVKQVSDLFSPLYLSEGIGVEYRPNKFFNLQIGGATLRQTIASTAVINNFIARNIATNTANGNKKLSETSAYGIDMGKNLLNELGFQVVANYNRDIAKNLNLKSRSAAFFAYSPKSNLSLRQDLVLTAKVNKYINVNFTALALYDKNIIDAWQFSEGLALGFLYTF